MARLPVVGGDDDAWGDILNQYLDVEHQADGTHDYAALHQSGLDSAKPAASSANTGMLYYSTDVQGGTMYRSNGSTWAQVSKGLTAPPAAHKSTHAKGGSDALSPNDIGASKNVNFFYPEDYGAVGDGTTDDTQAIQDCIDAAMTADSTAIVQFSPKTYLVNGIGGNLQTNRNGNCLLSIADVELSDKRISLVGAAGDGTPTSGWSAGKTIIKTTRTGDTYSATYGPPSVIGGATQVANASNPTLWSGVITIRDLTISLPTNPEIGGIDAISFGGFDFEGVQVIAGTGNDDTVPSYPHAFAFRTPGSFAFGIMRFRHCFSIQMYAGYVCVKTDHIVFESAYAWHNYIAIAFQDPQPGVGSHPITGEYFMSERCLNILAGWDPTIGKKSLTSGKAHIMDLKLDVETYTGVWAAENSILDANNCLYGRVNVHYWTVFGPISTLPGTLSGGQNLDIRYTQQPRLSTTRTAAPSSNDVGNGQMVLWFDQTAGASKLMITARDSSSATSWNSGTLRTGSLPLDGTTRTAYTMRTVHTFTFQGTVSVISLPSFFFSKTSGQTTNAVKTRYKIGTGTNTTFKIQKNGADWTGYGTSASPLTATTTATETVQTNALADNDEISLVIVGTSGTPTDLTVTLVLEHTI